MPQFFVHYLRRNLRTFIPKASDKDKHKKSRISMADFEKPTYHSTGATNGPAAEIKPGDTIWIVGQLYTPWGKLPPSIDARIDVISTSPSIKDNKHIGFRYTAAESSKWFPLADASTLMQSLQSVDREGSIRPLWPESQPFIGKSLQKPRKLVDDSFLHQWEKKVDDGFDFISYRLLDGSKSAFDTVLGMIQSGACIWWDRWSLPRRLAERREYVRDEILKSHIDHKIINAKRVWGIPSLLYAEEGSYSADEKAVAENTGKFQMIHLISQ